MAGHEAPSTQSPPHCTIPLSLFSLASPSDPEEAATIQMRTPEAMGPGIQEVILKPSQALIQCLAVLSSTQCPQGYRKHPLFLIPAICLLHRPPLVLAQPPLVPQTVGRSSGEQTTPVTHLCSKERELWDKGWRLGRNFTF